MSVYPNTSCDLSGGPPPPPEEIFGMTELLALYKAPVTGHLPAGMASTLQPDCVSPPSLLPFLPVPVPFAEQHHGPDEQPRGPGQPLRPGARR